MRYAMAVLVVCGAATASVRAGEPVKAGEVIENSIGMRLVVIPAGEFEMGSEDGMSSDDGPVHCVRITKPFFLGVTEATNAQWKMVSGSPRSLYMEDDQPVQRVRWDEAVKFCEQLSALPAEKEAGRAYRLPTEAEWEYACRAGTKTLFSCGNDEATLGDFAWFKANAEGKPHAVGTKKANPWGLHDMHGNIDEWCSDWYDGTYYAKSPPADPQGPDFVGSRRVVRGGNWLGSSMKCRSASRFSASPADRGNGGFRVVCELE